MSLDFDTVHREMLTRIPDRYQKTAGFPAYDFTAAFAHAIKLLGGRVRDQADYQIPGTEITHRVVAIEKVAPTLKGYPRRWAKIQKEPL